MRGDAPVIRFSCISFLINIDNLFFFPYVTLEFCCMHAAVKSALKAKTKEWNSLQKRGFSNAEEMLTKKLSFLEDVLSIYQEEIVRLTQQTSAGAPGARGYTAGAGAGDDGGAADALADAAHYFQLFQGAQQEIKQLTDEIAYLRNEQNKTATQANEHFQRALARHQERHQQSIRMLQQEAEVDKSRIAALEAEIAQLRAEREGRVTEELMGANHQIESLERELVTTRRELGAEQRRAADLERDLLISRRKVAQASDFMAHVETLAGRVVDSIAKQSEHHQRIVNMLVLERSPDSGSAEKEMDGRTSSDGVETETAHARHKKSSRDAVLERIIVTSGSTASSTEQLQLLLQLWESDCEAQHLELSVAARCSQEQQQKEAKHMTAKLMESFGHCELLMKRIQQMDVQHAEMKEFIHQERDRALDARDRAVVLVRALEQAKDRRFAVATVGVQTVRSEMGK